VFTQSTGNFNATETHFKYKQIIKKLPKRNLFYYFNMREIFCYALLLKVAPGLLWVKALHCNCVTIKQMDRFCSGLFD